MTAQEVDAYLDGAPEPQRSTLRSLRATILEIIPQAEQGMSYAMPAFRVEGKVVAGFAAFTRHVAYLPHSGSVLAELSTELDGYEQTKGSLHLPVDAPPPKELIEKLISVRLRQLGLTA